MTLNKDSKMFIGVLIFVILGNLFGIMGGYELIPYTIKLIFAFGVMLMFVGLAIYMMFEQFIE